MRKWIYRTLAVLLSVSLVAAAVEITLWTLAPTPYHEFVTVTPDGHVKGRAKPGQLVHTAAGDEIRINHLGFRGPDWEWHPDPGTLRLITLGGSSTL